MCQDLLLLLLLLEGKLPYFTIRVFFALQNDAKKVQFFLPFLLRLLLFSHNFKLTYKFFGFLISVVIVMSHNKLKLEQCNTGTLHGSCYQQKCVNQMRKVLHISIGHSYVKLGLILILSLLYFHTKKFKFVFILFRPVRFCSLHCWSCSINLQYINWCFTKGHFM